MQKRVGENVMRAWSLGECPVFSRSGPTHCTSHEEADKEIRNIFTIFLDCFGKDLNKLLLRNDESALRHVFLLQEELREQPESSHDVEQ